jgi:hypothetical protein
VLRAIRISHLKALVSLTRGFWTQGKGACGATQIDNSGKGLKRSLFGSVKDLSREFYTSYVGGTVSTANADARGTKLQTKERVVRGYGPATHPAPPHRPSISLRVPPMYGSYTASFRMVANHCWLC